MAQNYILGQGKVYVDSIDPTTKLPLGMGRWLGNVPNGGLTFSFETQEYNHMESYTGQRLTDLKIELSKSLKGTLKIEDLSKENLALFLYGTGGTVAGATITDESHIAYAGYSFRLNHCNLSSFTALTGTGGTPTYVNGTDYTVDLKSGRVTILAGGDITDETEVLADYVAGAYDRTTAFNVSNTEYWLTFDGLNNASGDEPIICDVFKARFSPPKNFDLLSEAVISLEMAFEGLYQETLASAAATKGGFFRLLKPAAV